VPSDFMALVAAFFLVNVLLSLLVGAASHHRTAYRHLSVSVVMMPPRAPQLNIFSIGFPADGWF